MTAHVKHYLRLWHENVQTKNFKTDQANLIIKRVYHKVLRAGWQKYKRGFDLIVQEEKFAKR